MNKSAKIAVGVVAALVVVWLLFTVVFPWFDSNFVTDPVLESVGTAGRG